MMVDKYGELMPRAWLTTVADTYSRCLVGFNLGYDEPSSKVVALALRHAILPKKYDLKYELNCDWNSYGLPEYLYTDSGKDFRSNHLAEIATQLGFVLTLRDYPSGGGIIERPFKTINTSFLAEIDGYTGSNVQERPKSAEKDACLTLQELETKLVRYIIDHYNQKSIAGKDEQTRYQRWEAGFITRTY